MSSGTLCFMLQCSDKWVYYVRVCVDNGDFHKIYLELDSYIVFKRACVSMRRSKFTQVILHVFDLCSYPYLNRHVSGSTAHSMTGMKQLGIPPFIPGHVVINTIP